MSPNLLQLVLVLSCLCLAGMGAIGLLVARAQTTRDKVKARIAAVAPLARGQLLPPATATMIRAGIKNGPAIASLLTPFGCDPARAHVYPVRWWIVLLAGCGVGYAAAAGCSAVMGDLGYVAWPFVWIATSRAAFGRWEGKRKDLLLKQFPDALAMIIRCVRVGIPVTESVRLVARELPDPTGAEFRQLGEEIAIGIPVDAALLNAAQRTSLPEYRFFATALTLQAQTGGGLSQALEGLADVIRRRLALRARGYALTSEARTSTLVLTAMPFVVGGVLFFLSPGYISILFTDTAGPPLLATALGLICAAVVIMRKIIRNALA
ncbi:MAG: type II secretion system F family protein [Acetobacteraceae bacterium]|nr:type II secretion system F family protein [Acetobacteraceae bacterium]